MTTSKCRCSAQLKYACLNACFIIVSPKKHPDGGGSKTVTREDSARKTAFKGVTDIGRIKRSGPTEPNHKEPDGEKLPNTTPVARS